MGGTERCKSRTMSRFSFRVFAIVTLGLSLLVMPVSVRAQGYSDKPPIAQALVREGTLAVELQAGLNLGTGWNETMAEQRLAKAGIAPEKGWSSDEPVTPGVIGQIQDSISRATDNGRLPMGKEEALDRFQAVASSLNLPVKPYTDRNGTGEYSGTYSDQQDLDSYYAQEGPPDITYYTPPPGYYGMYTWVPYPFWWNDVPFSGYYILDGHGHDFHHHHHDHHDHDRHGSVGSRDSGGDGHAASGVHAAAPAQGMPTMESQPARTGTAPVAGPDARTVSPVRPHAGMEGRGTGQVHHGMSRGNAAHHQAPPASHEGPAVSRAPGVPTIESQPPAIPNARMTPPSAPAPGVTVSRPDHPSAGHVKGGPVSGPPERTGGMHGGFHGAHRR